MAAAGDDEQLSLLTARLRLRCWRDTDRQSLRRLYADPVVMRDYGDVFDHATSDARLTFYRDTCREFGFSRWVVETLNEEFLGYVGIMPRYGDGHPLGDHEEIGWRLKAGAWGKGYATEAARAALADGFERVRLSRVFAYTSADNFASQAVMNRLGMTRERTLDFTVMHNLIGRWSGLVWSTEGDTSKDGRM